MTSIRILYFIVCLMASLQLGAENVDDKFDRDAAQTPAERAASFRQLIADSNKPAPSLLRAIFTTAIKGREPVDSISRLDNRFERIYFFSELANLKGHTVSHRWIYQGEVKAELHFKVGSDRWRINSSKNLLPEWQGDWQVLVVDDLGNEIGEQHFVYGDLSPVSTNEQE